MTSKFNRFRICQGKLCWHFWISFWPKHHLSISGLSSANSFLTVASGFSPCIKWVSWEMTSWKPMNSLWSTILSPPTKLLNQVKLRAHRTTLLKFKLISTLLKIWTSSKLNWSSVPLTMNSIGNNYVRILPPPIKSTIWPKGVWDISRK